MNDTPQRVMAMAVMEQSRVVPGSSFVARLQGLPGAVTNLPRVTVPGALPAFKYNLVKPKDFKLPVSLLMQFAIGDFLEHGSCSTYFDPDSPWYNVFYGAYIMRSHKADGAPWGFDASGRPDVDEFLEIPRIDYTYLTAGMFGCPPDRMDWRVSHGPLAQDHNDWWRVDVSDATIPSGLHLVPNRDVDYPLAYLMYGVPKGEFLAGGRTAFEKVPMTGRLFLKALRATDPGDGSDQRRTPVAITVAWGALCPKTAAGRQLLETIIGAMAPQFLAI